MLKEGGEHAEHRDRQQDPPAAPHPLGPAISGITGAVGPLESGCRGERWCWGTRGSPPGMGVKRCQVFISATATPHQFLPPREPGAESRDINWLLATPVPWAKGT